MKKNRIILSRITEIKDFKVIGYMVERPIVGNELKFKALNGETIFSQEIIESVKEMKNLKYPGRIKIRTFWNSYVADDLNFISQNSRSR